MKLKITNSKYPLFVQTYSSHPFIDIYSTVCSKETAYDNICNIVNESHINRLENKNIIYFGIQKMTILHSEKQIFQ